MSCNLQQSSSSQKRGRGSIISSRHGRVKIQGRGRHLMRTCAGRPRPAHFTKETFAKLSLSGGRPPSRGRPKPGSKFHTKSSREESGCQLSGCPNSMPPNSGSAESREAWAAGVGRAPRCCRRRRPSGGSAGRPRCARPRRAAPRARQGGAARAARAASFEQHFALCLTWSVLRLQASARATPAQGAPSGPRAHGAA